VEQQFMDLIHLFQAPLLNLAFAAQSQYLMVCLKASFFVFIQVNAEKEIGPFGSFRILIFLIAGLSNGEFVPFRLKKSSLYDRLMRLPIVEGKYFLI